MGIEFPFSVYVYFGLIHFNFATYRFRVITFFTLSYSRLYYISMDDIITIFGRLLRDTYIYVRCSNGGPYTLLPYSLLLLFVSSSLMNSIGPLVVAWSRSPTDILMTIACLSAIIDNQPYSRARAHYLSAQKLCS